MKKLVSLFLIALLSIGSFACSSQASGKSNLTQKIEKICNHQTVKTLLDGKKISDILKAGVEQMTDSEKEQAKKYGLSFDVSNFATEDSTYAWLAEALQTSLKYSITNGDLTQEIFDQARTSLTLFGITMPDLKISSNMSDSDISKICESFADIAERFLDPNVLKMMGIDINDPNSISNLLQEVKLFN